MDIRGYTHEKNSWNMWDKSNDTGANLVRHITL